MRILRWSNVRKTLQYLKKNGIRHACYAAMERVKEEKREQYTYHMPSPELLDTQRIRSCDYPWTFSIVVPAYETKETFLREMIGSVLAQSYQKWELILADASTSDRVQQMVEEIQHQTKDERIRYLRLSENRGISENTNAGLRVAAGEYLALLDHDDLLTPDALYEMAEELMRCRQQGITPALLYSDEDKYDDNTCSYQDLHAKMDFNLDLILSNNYICHFMAVEKSLFQELLLRRDYDGAQDYDLVLRVVGRMLKSRTVQELPSHLRHIPKVLYHWRCHAASTAENTASKAYAYEAGKRALENFLDAEGWRAEVRHSLHLGFYELRYLPDILSVRQDVGIVGGRLVDGHHRICGGIYTEDGAALYRGLHEEYSGGKTHRAVLKQDCASVDIRCLRVRRELWEVYREITGIPYTERELPGRSHRREERRKGNDGQRCADISALVCDEAGYRKLGTELCREAVRRGYVIVWDPSVTYHL